MRLEQLTITPHPDGNRLDLTWVNPQPDTYPDILVLRGTRTYPLAPDSENGSVVSLGANYTIAQQEDGKWRAHLIDAPLQGERTYYYTLFPVPDNGPPVTQARNQVAAMATSPYGLAEQMYRMLPGIFKRYDTRMPAHNAGVAPADGQQGQLRRFLDLPGNQLDQIYSFARTMLDLHDLDRIDGRLLSLLAQWIGWQINHREDLNNLRQELGNASYIYRTIGIIPTLEATVKRLIGWESRTKEFRQNIVYSNRPEQGNIWTYRRTAAGLWKPDDHPLSLDQAYEGRLAVTQDNRGTTWLFYHTLQGAQCSIWYKTLDTFAVDGQFRVELDQHAISNRLQQAFSFAGYVVSLEAFVETQEDRWTITDNRHNEIYHLRDFGDELHIERWTASRPLINDALIDRYPAAISWDDRLWVFWSSYDPLHRTSSIIYVYGERTQGTLGDPVWSEIRVFQTANDGNMCKDPVLQVDPDTDRLWLGWLEKADSRWEVNYQVYERGVEVIQPTDPRVMPGNSSRLELRDLAFAIDYFNDSLIFFWAQANDQGRYRIAYQIKDNMDLASNSWGGVTTLPVSASVDTNYDERDPFLLWSDQDTIDLYYSSNIDRSWSIWQQSYSLANELWSDRQAITPQPFTERHPAVITVGAERWLFFRSNRSVTYHSNRYSATQTLDIRYCGSTTVDTRNAVKGNLQGQYRDFQTYTFDTGQTDANWYSSGTVGIYLTPNTEDPGLIERNRHLIANVLRQFLPIHARAVLFIEPSPHREPVYTYEFPDESTQRKIAEMAYDSLLPERYDGLSDQYQDSVPGWEWMYSWSPERGGYLTVNFEEDPIITHWRTWHTGLG